MKAANKDNRDLNNVFFVQDETIVSDEGNEDISPMKSLVTN